MLQPNAQDDPIVEILISAYRRGLAIQREKEQKGKVINPQSLQDEIVTEGQELAREIEEAHPDYPSSASRNG